MAEKLYYSISEVAEMIGVNLSLLRYWEKEFPFICPKKTDKRTRLYTQENINDIKLVYHLVKEKKLTLEGAKKRLRENKDGIAKNHEIVFRLQEIQKEIKQIKGQFNTVLKEIEKDENNVV
ncbi:MAG: MerR family transcriptional regulator [Prevotellaceae bacterium]|jgi:DNA-binding transcriptional MerR regulator|nr:MerR family transcriptional regulator [Prevotellaceae bacterium]